MEIEIYTKEDLKITPKNAEAVVSSITIDLAKNVYGETTKKPDQELFVLTLENDSLNIKTSEVIAKYERGNVPDTSKLGLFLQKYDSFEVGMKVKINKDKNNFWKIEI